MRLMQAIASEMSRRAFDCGVGWVPSTAAAAGDPGVSESGLWQVASGDATRGVWLPLGAVSRHCAGSVLLLLPCVGPEAGCPLPFNSLEHFAM